MENPDHITQLIFEVVDEHNKRAIEASFHLQKSPGTSLYGASSVLDSLGLVHFIVDVEQKIEDSMNRSLTLADESAMSLQNSPFRTIGTLAEYIRHRLAE